MTQLLITIEIMHNLGTILVPKNEKKEMKNDFETLKCF